MQYAQLNNNIFKYAIYLRVIAQFGIRKIEQKTRNIAATLILCSRRDFAEDPFDFIPDKYKPVR